MSLWWISIFSITAEDAKTETVALSVTRCIFPNADAARIDGQAKTVVNIAVSWAANDSKLTQRRKKKKMPGK
jgi:hypothetical protein